MKKATIVIAALAVSNLATAGALAWSHRSKPEIYVDHLEDLRVSVNTDGLLRAQLGDSRTQTSVHVAFTAHGAIQLQQELGRMFALIQSEAAKEAAAGQAAHAPTGQSL